MHSDSDIIYDSEPERIASQITTTRSHLRRTSDERPGLSSEDVEGVRRKKSEQEVLVLDSDGSEDDSLPNQQTTKSKYFVSTSSTSTTAQPKSPTKRRRTRSPPPPTIEGWPFSGQVRIGSRSPPPPPNPSQQRQKSRSLSFSTTSSPNEPAPVASTSKPSSSRRRDESSPFVTARDLLNSRSTPIDPDYSQSPPEPVKPKRTTKNGLKAQDSASSVEIIESSVRKGKGKKGKVVEKEEADSDDDLPDPADWVKQFSMKKDGEKGKGKAKEESASQSATTGGAKRKKPWEVMEAKAATTTKKPTRKPVVKKKVVQAKKEEETDPEESDIEIVSSRSRPRSTSSSSTTALKPSPSGRIPHFTSTTTNKKPSLTTLKSDLKDSLLFNVPAPLLLPSDDRIKCLSHCPLCAFSSSHKDRPRTTVDSWGTKALSTRSNHLRLCAKSHDYTSETVSHLVNQQILVLAKESESKRLEKELGKSLFDRAIGKGEGTSGKEVSVVGFEGEGDWGSVQEEVDAWRKKGKRGGIEDRLRRVAREIRLELEDLEVANRDEGGKTKEEEGEEKEGLEMPRATGRLRPETEEDRNEISRRAKELLEMAKGTGLTQAPTPVMVLDEDSTDVGKISSIEEDDDLRPPPATQTFEPSTLANRCRHDGAINIVRPLASSPDSKGKGKRARSRSPIPELDLAFSSDEENLVPRNTSLWKANAGIDEDSLKRVVHSHSRPSGSPSPPPRSSSPFISPSTALHPLSTLTLSSASSSTSSLPDPATWMQIGSSRNLATSRRNSPSPTRRKGKGKGLIEESVKRLGLGEPRSEFGGLNDGMEWMDEGEDAWEYGGAGVLVGGAREGETGREGEVASSEEESLANLLARTPTKSKRKNKKTPSPEIAVSKPSSSRRRISPSSPSASSASDSSLPAPPSKPAKKRGDPPSMPTYSSLPLTTLQKEVQKYGFRPSKEKSVLVSQLKDVWRAMNKDKVEAWERGEEVFKKTRKKKPVEEKEGAEVKTKGRRKRGAVVEDEVEEEPGETRTVGERLRELIVNEAELYCRILRYEPIHIDEFILLAANNNVKVARMLLIRCLDEQSITFYQEDPTNGQRKRHR